MEVVEQNTTETSRKYREQLSVTGSAHADVVGAVQTIVRAIEALECLRELPSGWAGEEWCAPDSDAVQAARRWLLQLWSQTGAGASIWLPPHITASPQGDVVLEWWHDPKKLTVYISAQSTEYLKVWGTNIFEEMEEGVTNSPLALMEWLQSD